ncbi:MAG: ATP-binding protein [Dissulfurispiraceae bacterium]|jgi:two-component system phosphate regulon sensor histidine kinase PhoR
MGTPVIVILSIIILFFVIYVIRMRLSVNAISNLLQDISSGNLNARLFTNSSGKLDTIARDIIAIVEKTSLRLGYAEAEMQRMEAILRGMSDGVLITDAHDMVILANRTFKKLLSVTENIEGKQIMDVVRNVQLIDIVRKALESWEIISDEIAVTRGNREIFLIATAVPIYSEDSVRGIVLTLHDITRLRQLEEVRKDFVANVSHEIKTPITAIKGFAETLLDGALDDKDNAARFLIMIKNHSERLNSLVDDLLALSGIELGDVKINKTEISLEQVIDTVFMTLKDKADKKGLYLRKKLPQNAQVFAADKDKLIQIIINLVDNGIKFTEKGGVTVGVDETGGRVALFVQDTGIGIPPKYLNRLGERFYRVDSARSRELGGTGLGLAIVKHLVGAHGWSMRIESAYGKGTRVNVIIDRYL